MDGGGQWSDAVPEGVRWGPWRGAALGAGCRGRKGRSALSQHLLMHNGLCYLALILLSLLLMFYTRTLYATLC